MHTALRAQMGFDVISPPLRLRPSESRQVPRLSDFTHLPSFGAQLASQEGPSVCIYVYVCTCVYVYIYDYVCTYVHMHICAHMCICIHIHHHHIITSSHHTNCASQGARASAISMDGWLDGWIDRQTDTDHSVTEAAFIAHLHTPTLHRNK